MLIESDILLKNHVGCNIYQNTTWHFYLSKVKENLSICMSVWFEQ